MRVGAVKIFYCLFVGMLYRVLLILMVLVNYQFFFCRYSFRSLVSYSGDRGGTVVKLLCYGSEGRLFDPSWCHWNFSLT